MNWRDQAKRVPDLARVIARIGNRDPPKDIGIEYRSAPRPVVRGSGLDTLRQIADALSGGAEGMEARLDVSGPTVADRHLQGIDSTIKEHHDDLQILDTRKDEVSFSGRNSRHGDLQKRTNWRHFLATSGPRCSDKGRARILLIRFGLIYAKSDQSTRLPPWVGFRLQGHSGNWIPGRFSMISALEVALLVMVLDQPAGALTCEMESESAVMVRCSNGTSATETSERRIRFNKGITVEKTEKGGLVFSNGISASRTAVGWIRFSNGAMARTSDRRTYTFASGHICEAISMTHARCRIVPKP